APDSGRPGPVRRREELGDHRLRADVRGAAPARRTGRRCGGAEGRVHRRGGGFHLGVAGLRAVLLPGDAYRRPGAAGAAPTGLALIASTYAVGQARNRAIAVSAAMQGAGSVLGLVLGGAFTVISWRLAFLINVPIGIVIIGIAVTRLRETHRERLRLDASGAVLATLGCTTAVLV